MRLTANQYDILDHTALRAANGFFCGDSEDMQILVGLGLMRSAGTKPSVPDEYFSITPLGKQARRDKPPAPVSTMWEHLH